VSPTICHGLCSLKIFSPMLAWGCLVLIPVNKTDNELISYQAANPNFVYSAVDTISIANVHDKSKRYVPGMLIKCGCLPSLSHGRFCSRQPGK
jgi:hypothetical protein